MKFVVSTIGDPYSAKTYSGVPFQLFKEMDKQNLIVERVDGFDRRPADFIFGDYWDISRSIKRLRPTKSSIWRFRTDSRKKLSHRLTQKLKDVEYDVFLQIGCGGLPNDNSIKVAHVEIPIQYAASEPFFADTYGYSNQPDRKFQDAIAGQKQFFEECDLIWTNTEWTKSLLIDAGASDNKIFVFPPCINFDPSIEYIEKEFSTPKILFIGKDWERKGGPLLLETFSLLLENHPDAELTIIGCHPDTMGIKNINALGFINIKEEQGKIIFDEALSKSNIFCVPSNWESTGIVYFEAMQHSLPVIMLNGQGREQIFSEISFVSEDAEARSLLRTINKVISNPMVTNEITKQAYNIVMTKYNYRNLVREMIYSIENISCDTY